MFMPVLESMGKISAATVEMQQELFKKWFSLWPAFTNGSTFPSAWGEQIQRLQKKWTEVSGDLMRRQRELIEAQFKAGQQNIEKAFSVCEAKSPDELRTKTLEFWQKCLESMRQTSELQMREFQSAIEKWTDLMKPMVPSS